MISRNHRFAFRKRLFEITTALLIGLWAPALTFAQNAAESLFTSQSPMLTDASDGVPYELGMKFQLARSGQITAIRYWKSPSDSAVHVGRIWSASGTLLASVTFTGESSIGWQQQALEAPLSVQSNTVYVVSVNSGGNFPTTVSGLATAITNGDISSVADGSNALFGTPGVFPTRSFRSANYFRDIVFVPGDTVFTTQTPALPSASDNVPYEIGMKFEVTGGGNVAALRFWKATGDAGPHVGRLWSATGTLLSSVTFTNETGSGWQQQALATPVALQPNTTYVVSVNITSNFPMTTNGLAGTIVNGSVGSVADGSNGVFGAPFAFPTRTYKNSNYFRDVLFFPSTAAVLPPPPAVKIALTPTSASTVAGVPVTYSATIQDANGGTVTGATNSITFGAGPLAGAWSPASPVAAVNGVATTTFTPIDSGTATISATSTGLTDANTSLTVVTPPSPQSLFAAQTPANPSATDNASYELGMKFQVAKTGSITAIRYYKSSGDAGTHVGRIWSSTGTLLASVMFASETTSGWQQQALAQPLVVQAGATYVVSVNIFSRYAFTNNGLASPIVNGDVSSIADGNNGVYGPSGQFPTKSYQNSNYFRDVVFVAGGTGPAIRLALTPISTASHTGVPIAYTATIQDAGGGRVFSATNAVTFSVSGVSGSFSNIVGNAVSGAATTVFTPTSTGIATIKASAAGLAGATVSATINDVDVTTYHSDSLRTGWNAAEPILTPGNVGGGGFGLLQTVPLDEQVDAQPLVVSGQNINGQRVHNVVYVVTENNTVYAVDGSSGAILLQTNLGTPVPKAALPGSCSNSPTLGISATPVIDRAAGTMYVIAYTYENGAAVYRLHALDLSTLADKVPAVVISASHKLTDGSTYNFSARTARLRAGLVLSSGNVYAGFTSFCDLEYNNTRGWVLGWNATSLAPLTANRLNNTLAQSPDAYYMSTIWMSGYGVAADAIGNLYFVTGNSDFSGGTYDGVNNIQQSVVKLSSDLMQIPSIFTPSGADSGVDTLDLHDDDFGSGGVMLLPDQPGTHPRLAVAAGKIGEMYLMDRDNLGGYNPAGANNVLGTYDIGGCYCGPSYFAGADGVGRIVASGGAQITTWTVRTDVSTTLALEGTSDRLSTGQRDGFFTSVSSNGSDAGSFIIWAVSRPVDLSPAQVLLYAFNAQPDNGRLTLLYSGIAGAWENARGSANIVPVVANGYVYVASNKRLAIFGLTQPLSAATQTAATLAEAAEERPAQVTVGQRDAIRDPGVSLVSYALNELDATDWTRPLITSTSSGEIEENETSSPYVLTADATPPDLPPGTSRLYGKVTSVEGNYCALELRDGRTVQVDIGEARHEGRSVVPVVGKAVVVMGRFAASGVLHAILVLRAMPSERLWEPDVEPR
jgi:hypothetical protein